MELDKVILYTTIILILIACGVFAVLTLNETTAQESTLEEQFAVTDPTQDQEVNTKYPIGDIESVRQWNGIEWVEVPLSEVHWERGSREVVIDSEGLDG